MAMFLQKKLSFDLETFQEELLGIPIDERIAMSRIPMNFHAIVYKLMMSKLFGAQTRFRMAVRFVISQVIMIFHDTRNLKFYKSS